MAQFQHSSLERGKGALGLSAVASTVCVLRQRLPAARRAFTPIAFGLSCVAGALLARGVAGRASRT